MSGALCALAEAAPHTQAALGTGEPGLARTGSPGSPLPLTAPRSGSWRALRGAGSCQTPALLCSSPRVSRGLCCPVRSQHGPAAVRGPERHRGPRRAVSSPSAACARGTASAQAQTSFRFWEAAPGPTRQTPEPLATKPCSAAHGRRAHQHPAGTALLGGGGSLRHPCLGTRAPAARNACCGDRRLLRAGSRARGPPVPLSCVRPPPSHSQ